MTDRATKLARIPIHERFLLDEETAACMCSVGLNTFRHWVKGGLLHPVRMPFGENRKLYKRADVLAFVEALAYQDGK